MDKKQLSEADIRAKFIDPAILKAGWSETTQIYREYTIAHGRIVVRGQKAQRNKHAALFADYLLCWQYGQPLAVVEAKDNTHSVGAGLQQATEYAERMGVPFAFASNGDGFVFRDATLSDGELVREISLEEFPSPQDLWERYCAWKGWTPAQKQVNAFAYHQGDSSRVPRYYQLHAINRALEAIAAGQNRVLLEVLMEELAQEKARAVRWPRPTPLAYSCTWPMTSPCSPAAAPPMAVKVQRKRSKTP